MLSDLRHLKSTDLINTCADDVDFSGRGKSLQNWRGSSRLLSLTIDAKMSMDYGYIGASKYRNGDGFASDVLVKTLTALDISKSGKEIIDQVSHRSEPGQAACTI